MGELSLDLGRLPYGVWDGARGVMTLVDGSLGVSVMGSRLEGLGAVPAGMAMQSTLWANGEVRGGLLSLIGPERKRPSWIRVARAGPVAWGKALQASYEKEADGLARLSEGIGTGAPVEAILAGPSTVLGVALSPGAGGDLVSGVSGSRPGAAVDLAAMIVTGELANAAWPNLWEEVSRIAVPRLLMGIAIDAGERRVWCGGLVSLSSRHALTRAFTACGLAVCEEPESATLCMLLATPMGALSGVRTRAAARGIPFGETEWTGFVPREPVRVAKEEAA